MVSSLIFFRTASHSRRCRSCRVASRWSTRTPDVIVSALWHCTQCCSKNGFTCCSNEGSSAIAVPSAARACQTRAVHSNANDGKQREPARGLQSSANDSLRSYQPCTTVLLSDSPVSSYLEKAMLPPTGLDLLLSESACRKSRPPFVAGGSRLIQTSVAQSLSLPSEGMSDSVSLAVWRARLNIFQGEHSERFKKRNGELHEVPAFFHRNWLSLWKQE